MKTKGKFFWKKRWYSFCSQHMNTEENCLACNTGSWVNVWGLFFSNLLYKVSPKFWRWIINL